MKRLLSSLVLGWVSALLVVTPVRGADREHQQMMADIRMLQEQTVRLGLMLGTFDETLKTLLTTLDAQAQDTRRAFADQRLLVDNLAGGVRIVREKVDETNVRVSSLAQEFEALRLAIPQRMSPLTQLLVDPETGLPTAQTPVPAAAAVAPVNPGVSPQRLYDTAWADYTTGEWALAIQGFEVYISSFPRSELADDAQFYIGNTTMQTGSIAKRQGPSSRSCSIIPMAIEWPRHSTNAGWHSTVSRSRSSPGRPSSSWCRTTRKTTWRISRSSGSTGSTSSSSPVVSGGPGGRCTQPGTDSRYGNRQQSHSRR